MSKFQAAAEKWLAQDPDPVTRAELEQILQSGDEEALASRFAKRLQFGTAGLRGELGAGPNRMNRVLVAQAAAGIAKYLGAGSTVVIGFDGRINSDIFAKDSAEIISGFGLKVYLLDQMCPTPLVAFATKQLRCDAGIMVTASHNPPNDNGYKVYMGREFNGSQIIAPVDVEIAEQIQEIADTTTFDELPKLQNYEVIGEQLRADYIASVLKSSERIHSHRIKIAYTAMHGVGWKLSQEIFNKAGFEDVHPVEKQIQPDGKFPTVKFPNPEEPGAMDLTIKLAKEIGADLGIAHDPDADRAAVLVRHAGNYKMLTGDQVGLILADEIASHADSGSLACSIVSSSALEKVAEHYGLDFHSTLTGFKWISKVPNLIFGYEEALGYCVDPAHVLDKDGISASLLIAKIAARELSQGRTLIDLLSTLGEKYGHFATGQVSQRLTSVEAVVELVTKLRANPPSSLGGESLVFTDLAKGSLDLPPTDGLRFDIGQKRVIIRPSGTEPKLKCYLQVISQSEVQAQQELELLRQNVNELLSNLG